MRLKGESYSIDVGTFVMNFHHKLLRLGVVREKRTGDHGWAYFQVDWFEDDIAIAAEAWNKKMGSTTTFSGEVRGDFLTPVSTKWLQNVLSAYGEYQDERRTEDG